MPLRIATQYLIKVKLQPNRDPSAVATDVNVLFELVRQALQPGSRWAGGISPDRIPALAEMAADPQMRRELAEIAQEFTPTEMDGLEQL